ncbi:restriction modification system DNA specificity domain [Chlorobium limicola DSM 245]|uniref:Restriction modification system DNA specificity domain n=1 Tax=Chlorobium limicola (strain DSM 245 / NBRC 103803 / 6330) TaxID=290315 RepID=B3EIH5_CHLL2|nr:restriction endonuclease subunit S [Chlorobium limicola]ACD91487.1 restriction modification system DNA specificity domain [Chlorobium limicola DSM 245]
MNVENLQCADASLETIHCQQSDGDSGDWMKVGLTESTLAEVCSLVTDGTHDTPKRVETGYPLVKAKEISGGRIDFDNCDQISEQEHLKVIARSKPEFGDTLFAHIGASLGEAAFVNTTREFSIKNVALFKPNPSVIDARYLYYLVVSPAFQSLAKGTRTGSAQPFLGLSQLRGHQIQYHRDLAHQRRISGILSAYDDLIENRQRRIRILEEMARSLYREWFVHFRFPGHENHPLVPSSLGVIPQGWEVKKLGDIAESMRRNVSKGKLEERTPYVGLEHIPRQSLALDAWEMATALGSNKLEFKKGEVLFGKIRPYFHKVSVAPFVGLCSADTIVIRALRPEHYGIVVACVSSDEFVAVASATANGAKMPRANWNVLEKYQVVIPKGNLAEKFSALFADIIAQQQTLIFKIQNLRQTRDLLLPRLLSGEVKLKETDEPL